MITDFFGEPSKGSISGMTKPQMKSLNISEFTVPCFSSTASNPSSEIAVNAEILLLTKILWPTLVVHIQTFEHNCDHHSLSHQSTQNGQC